MDGIAHVETSQSIQPETHIVQSNLISSELISAASNHESQSVQFIHRIAPHRRQTDRSTGSKFWMLIARVIIANYSIAFQVLRFV